MAESIVITRDWIHAHSTPGGGWTAQQLAVFDIPWPPRKGWLSKLIGQEMSSEQKVAFEQLYQEQQTRRRRIRERHHRSNQAPITVVVNVTIPGRRNK